MNNTNKITKENDEFVWRQTNSGLGYVYSKIALWIFLEKEAEELEKEEIEYGKKYAEIIRQAYENKE